MLSLTETTRTLPYFAPAPLTVLPLIYHREHLFPYASYGDTAATPVPRDFRIYRLRLRSPCSSMSRSTIQVSMMEET